MTPRRLPIGSATLVALYLLFSGLSTVCLATANAVAPSHHHHSHQGAAHHSGLCSWACEANPASAVLSGAPTLPTLELALSASSLVCASGPLVSLVFLPSRAPPR